MHKYEGVLWGEGEEGREGGRVGIPSIKGNKKKNASTQQIHLSHAITMDTITKLRNNRLCYSYLPLLNCNHVSSITLSTAKLSIFFIIIHVRKCCTGLDFV